MSMRYRLERSRRYGEGWVLLELAPATFSPAARGYCGSKQERLRFVSSGVMVELWEWAERIPVNPGDIQCTDFVAGWKLMVRANSPVPSADELAHYFAQ